MPNGADDSIAGPARDSTVSLAPGRWNGCEKPKISKEVAHDMVGQMKQLPHESLDERTQFLLVVR